jgi:hypothetical protein
MGDGIPDEGGLGCSAIRNQEINRLGCDSEHEDSICFFFFFRADYNRP